ncbi:IS3 family transposase [Phascolarctobacterium sp.]|uniref:IS3 family transposase n=1 Tax=Phascolarctobacterium sp. TaxID=2049039 RepID=UPI0034C6B2E2
MTFANREIIKYYNEKQIKEKLGWRSPVQYKLHLLAAKNIRSNLFIDCCVY